jgi:hypothetical protein
MVEVRHMDRMRLMLGLDSFDGWFLRETRKQRPNRAAGVTEIVTESRDLKPLCDCIGDAHFYLL